MPPFTPYARDSGELHIGSLFSEKRISDRYESLFEQICLSQSSVIHRLSKTYAEEQAYYRLLLNSNFRLEDLFREYGRSTSSCVEGRHVLALGDSTEFNLNSQVKNFSDGDQCGYLSDNRTRGLISHVTIALDADQMWGLGLCDVQLWSRPKAKKKKTSTEKERLAANEKESYKWALGVTNSEEVLALADKVTYVFDREADILRLYQHIETLNADFVIRVKSNRRLTSPDLLMSELVETLEPAGIQKLKVLGRKARKNVLRQVKARKGREAELEIRYSSVELKQCSRVYYLVDALETANSKPDEEEPIHWRILTSHQVNSLDDALQILKFYQARWFIEQLFRIIKTQGFELESTQLGRISSVRKQITMCLAAGFKVLQLTLARDHQRQMPIEIAYNKQQQECLSKLSNELEGNTDKQKNPHKIQDLAFATWVMARLGGWKGYQTKRPPGPITLLRGMAKFQQYLHAFRIFNDSS